MTELTDLERREQELKRKLALDDLVQTINPQPETPPQPATEQTRIASSQSSLSQLEMSNVSEQELMTSILMDMAGDEETERAWEALLANPELQYLIYQGFANGEEMFATIRDNPFGDRAAFILLSPCGFKGELTMFSKSLVPSTILARAQVGSLEGVQIGVGPYGIPIFVPGGGSEHAVSLLRRGRLSPAMVLSKEEVEAVHELIDKPFVSERMWHLLSNIYSGYRGMQEQLPMLMNSKTNLAEWYMANTLLEGGNPRKMAGKWWVLVGLGILGLIVLMLFLTGAIKT